jgi:periplasmic protein CpxP/Spy
MNRFTLSMCLACMLAIPVAQAADEEDHAAHHPATDQSQAVSPQDEKAAGMKMEKMQEQMKKMREQMDKIHSAKDPAERQKLMKEHMQSMQESMKMMGGMGGGIRGRDMTARARKDPAGPMSDAGDGMGMCVMMMNRHKSVEARMDMMQQMMEQMMEHESAEQQMERGR